jgi:hypothetical protein
MGSLQISVWCPHCATGHKISATDAAIVSDHGGSSGLTSGMPFNHQGERSNKGHQRMAARQKTIASMSDTGEPVPTPSGQGKQPEAGQFRLQVDRQTKSSYVSYEAAEQAGLVIKQAHPVVQVAVYDAVGGVNKVLELPKA